MTVRKSVLWFGEQMEIKLKENDGRQGWGHSDLEWLCRRIADERNELKRAIATKSDMEIIGECADVANFAMMIADIASRGTERHNGVNDKFRWAKYGTGGHPRIGLDGERTEP